MSAIRKRLVDFFEGVSVWFAIVYCTYIAIIVTTSLIIGYLSFEIARQGLTPSARFLHDVELPENTQYCPGDEMRVTLRIHAAERAAIIRIYRSWYSVDLNQTVVPDRGPLYAVISGEQSGEMDITEVVPDLLPGHYEYRRGVEMPGYNPSVVRVPFEIDYKCMSK